MIISKKKYKQALEEARKQALEEKQLVVTKVVPKMVPLKGISASVEIPEEMSCALGEEQIKKMLLEKFFNTILNEDIASIEVKNDYCCFDPLKMTKRYTAMMNYAFL